MNVFHGRRYQARDERLSYRPRIEIWNPVMKRRTKIVLLVAGLAVATPIASVVVLTTAFATAIDPQHHCESGFSKLIDCRYHWSSQTIGQGTPVFTVTDDGASPAPSNDPGTVRPLYAEVTSWAVVDCPTNYFVKRLLCADASRAAPVQAADDDAVTGLPRPKPWLAATAKDSTVIKAFHVETPLDLAGVLGFYRLELGKRGWSEDAGAVVGPDRAVIAFTTSDGPAQLRLTRQGDRTIADLSQRKPAPSNVGIKPMPGQARLLLGNASKEEAVITINAQTIKLAAGLELMDDPIAGRKRHDSKEIDLPPGKYRITLKIANGAAQNREFELAADETWGLVAAPTGVPLSLRVY